MVLVTLADAAEAQLDVGGLLIAGACLTWGIENSLPRKLSSSDPVRIAAG